MWKTPGILFKRVDRSRNQDPCGPDAETRTAGPREPTNEPATLQEKRGQTSTEATRGEPLPIGSLPRPRENDAVKGVVPPIQERDGIRRRRSKEPMGDRTEEERRTSEEEDAKDAWNPLQESGPEPESRSLRTQRRDEDRCPGEPTSEPATLQEKRGQTRYGISGQGERSRRQEAKGKPQAQH
ncbi:hypothetical protein NDU88_003505 [Pleurodeles waltl]|uniref:Uncharacterized protein n=1 Tax=Pleurodeles waltl TaxID=8319 RepID=A0AAV7VEC7_PLEWA|nr:hypothetical protein NDU88_003505 [Pleurodeles waltl]